MFNERGIPMSTWTSNELTKIGTAEELRIASLRDDGTIRKPVIIWVVRVDDNLYVRAVKGRLGPWFRGTQTRHEGHIRSGGVEKDVLFVEETDPDVNERIDAAYREKYRRYPKEYVDACLTPAARAATIKLVPRPSGS
jgi:hypothetical protein